MLHIVIECSAQLVIEEMHVNTIVLLECLFPGNITLPLTVLVCWAIIVAAYTLLYIGDTPNAKVAERSATGKPEDLINLFRIISH